MKKNLFGLIAFCALLWPTFALGQQTVKITPAERKIAELITADQLKDYLYYVASDEMGGRDTPSNGLDLTAKFMGTLLSRWGFKPAGDDGTFYQKMMLRRESVDPATTKLSIGGTSFAFNEDFFRLNGDNATPDNTPFVFGGDGWRVDAKQIDSLKGVDVRNKVVVLAGSAFSQRYLVGPPAGVTQAELKNENRGKDWADPVTNATEKGAAGVIVVAPAQLVGAWDQVRGFFSRGSTVPDKLRPASTSSNTPVLLAGPKVRDAIFGAGNDGLKTAPGDLGKSGMVAAKSKTEMIPTQNVVAVWEGSDPKLKSEYVAIGAHYDHVGVNPNARGEDKIFNGADDDGSGTVAVLAMAEALAKSKVRPKRSVLLVWHCGEEKGLWGSEYFNKFPTVDIKQVIAQLNIDMIGRSLDPNKVIKCDTPGRPCNQDLSGANAIYVIGSEMMSSTLGAVTKGVNDQYLKMTYDYRYDDPKDTNRFFFRSDHFNYAVNGIPIVFWFDGVHEDYHQPGDHPDKIDYVKMEKVTRTIFLTLWELTEIKSRPKVDKQLPPELTQR